MGPIDKIKENKKLMDFIQSIQKHLAETEIGDRSVVVAYYLLLSFFSNINHRRQSAAVL